MQDQEERNRPEHVRRNRSAWNRWAPSNVEPGRRAWQRKEPVWGIWGIPENEVHLLPDQVGGLDVVELGCGTAYVSAWLARCGARVTGIDISEEQLRTARVLQAEHGLSFPLVHCNTEHVPLADASFDLAISEYGVCIWCDAYRWIPEASRLLRPGGLLVFIGNGAIMVMCTGDDGETPESPELRQDYFGMHRFEYADGESTVEFHLGYGDWIRLLRANGFEVENMIELRPPEGATAVYPYLKAGLGGWARRWPSEEAWASRKRHVESKP